MKKLIGAKRLGGPIIGLWMMTAQLFGTKRSLHASTKMVPGMIFLTGQLIQQKMGVG
jgi:hypothetical protein